MKNKARELKEMLDALTKVSRKIVKEIDLTEDELNDMIHIYDKYQVNYPYIKDDRFRYGGKLYEVILSHTSLENWKPDELPALYKEVMPKGVIPEWVKPTGAHDAYNKGDKVTYEERVYESIIDSNSYSPTEYPQGWEEI